MENVQLENLELKDLRKIGSNLANVQSLKDVSVMNFETLLRVLGKPKTSDNKDDKFYLVPSQKEPLARKAKKKHIFHTILKIRRFIDDFKKKRKK